jgi:hypothetical protein
LHGFGIILVGLFSRHNQIAIFRTRSAQATIRQLLSAIVAAKFVICA